MVSPRVFLGLTFVTILLHFAIRIISVVHKARRRIRGEIQHRFIFGRMVTAYLALFFCAAVEGWRGLPDFRWAMCALGAVVYGLSGLLLWKSLADLGSAYSPDIELRSDQPLVQSGLYAWIRHPILVSGVLESLGMALSLNAPATALLSLLIILPVIHRRWRQEELALAAHFGQSYRDYSARVGAFIPNWIWP
jgi:protein-S-isoprenylcysteine O-methyltransferase Ste14